MQRDFQNCISVPLKSENFVFCRMEKHFRLKLQLYLNLKQVRLGLNSHIVQDSHQQVKLHIITGVIRGA